MKQIEKYSDKELRLFREFCKELCLKSESRSLREITKIALIEINGELDERKIRLEINFNDKRELLNFCDKENL